MRKLTSIAVLLFFGLSLFIPSLARSAEAQDDLDVEMQKDIIREQKEKAKSKAVSDKKDLPPIKMVLVKGGCFDMGDFTSEGDDDERPVHKVCLTDFYMMETEVTQRLYELVIGTNPSLKKDPDMPVHSVSYFAAKQFIKRLNELTGGFYRLPTEAEWEYAARSGGKKEKWPGINNEAELGNYCWYSDNSGDDIHKVRERKPNGLGLYDMAGNVWEWIDDYFDFDYYKVSPEKDPYGADNSFWKTVRGGSFVESPQKLRTTYRYAIEPDHSVPSVGFRLAE